MSDQCRRTPPWLFHLLEKQVVKQRFQLDASADKCNALCKKFYDEHQNGLKQRWYNPTYCNPPFADFGAWMLKARQEAYDRQLVACLVGPNGCSQSWFQEVAISGTIYAFDQRLVFFDSQTGKPTHGADRDSMCYVFGPNFWNALAKLGTFQMYQFHVKGMVVTTRTKT